MRILQIIEYCCRKQTKINLNVASFIFHLTCELSQHQLFAFRFRCGYVKFRLIASEPKSAAWKGPYTHKYAQNIRCFEPISHRKDVCVCTKRSNEWKPLAVVEKRKLYVFPAIRLNPYKNIPHHPTEAFRIASCICRFVSSTFYQIFHHRAFDGNSLSHWKQFTVRDILSSVHSCGSYIKHTKYANILRPFFLSIFLFLPRQAHHFMTICTDNNMNFLCLLAFLMRKKDTLYALRDYAKKFLLRSFHLLNGILFESHENKKLHLFHCSCQHTGQYNYKRILQAK